MKKLYIIISALVILSITAFAQNENRSVNSEEDTGKEKVKNQTLNFEDELVEGGLQKPELFYLLQKRNFNYKRLIRLRENFLPELRESSELVRKGGGF